MKKYVFGLLMTTVMLLSLAAPLVSTVAADEASWYMTVDGVLDSDYYSLYPYDAGSFSVGFSKFGELINSDENVGLEYAGAVDPYAFPAGSDVSATVPKRMWVQGWFINITYDHRTVGPRNVWAGALHSDAVVYGNDWIRVDFMNDRSLTYGEEDFRDPGYFIGAVPYASDLVNGGRKTNGTAVTDDIEVLYDGPREFIAVCRTTIYDHLIFEDDGTESDVALLQIAITIRFNKVKKCVVLYKDVKTLLVEKEGIKMKIQFSNRGEVDLGTAAVSSYAHFYTEGTAIEDGIAEGYPTVYDADWTLIRTEDPYDTEYEGYSAAGPFPQTSSATIDVAQAISPAPSMFESGYVWEASFWPSLSDWTIDGWDEWWHSMDANDPHYIDYRVPSEEPMIPFYIGEWDFLLYHTLDAQMRTQFRGVTQYGVMEQTDGSDANMMFGTNLLDSQVMYYLDETFNPWDLVDAVHKDTERWVEFPSNDFTTAWRPFLLASDWDAYCVFAERVIDLDTGALLTRGVQYTVTVDADGYGVFDLPGNGDYKVLYSTLPEFTLADVPAEVFTTSLNMSAAGGTFDDTLVFDALDFSGFTATDLLGCDHFLRMDDFALTLTLLSDAADFTAAWAPDTGYGLEGWADDFEVDIERTFDASWDFMIDADGPVIGPVVIDDGATEFPVDLVSMVIDVLDVHWTITPPLAKSIIVDELQFEVTFDLALSFNAAEEEMNATLTVDFNTAETIGPDVMYSAFERGRYEWIEVGRDAASVDSAGAALVAEAFDSYKKIGIGIGGADMNYTDPNNAMPFVMSPFGAGTSVADYKDSIFRAALKDDWCTYWAVASSNMIGVGGPLANLLSYYANDFTDAMYGLNQFAGTAYADAIVPVSCWNRAWPTNVFPYEDSYITYQNLQFAFGSFVLDLGYAAVTTYKDINGTVLFNVWGNTGRDTYYASMWLHGDEARGMMPGLIEMQGFPKGVTSIILEINYADPMHPTYAIPELLGTISETEYTDSGATDVSYPWVKGGIHDP